MLNMFWLISFSAFALYFGYLPAPFFYDSNDTFMDFFNVAYWAQRSDAFDFWRSIYFPFNLILSNFLFGDTFGVEPKILRSHYYIQFAIYLSIYILSGFLIYLSVKRLKFSKGFCLLVTLAFFVSEPFWVALERGNFIVFALLFLLLRNFKKVYLDAVLLSLAVNVKIYLLPLLFSELIRLKPIKYIYEIVIFFVTVVLFSILYSQPWFDSYLGNLTNFSKFGNGLLTSLWNPNSIFVYFDTAVQIFDGSITLILINILKYLLLVPFLYIISALFFFGNRIDRVLIEFSILVFLLSILQSPGGYSYLLLWAYLPTVLLNDKYRALLLPFLGTQMFFDIPVLPVEQYFGYNVMSYITGENVVKNIYLSTGPFIRIFSLFMISVILCKIIRSEKNYV